MDTINNRVQTIVNMYYKGNVSEFARNINVRQSTLNGILGLRKVNPTSETIEKILNATVVNINPEWLMTGKGEMIKEKEKSTVAAVSREAEQSIVENAILRKQLAEYKKEVKELTEIAAVLNYQLELMEKENKTLKVQKGD